MQAFVKKIPQSDICFNARKYPVTSLELELF